MGNRMKESRQILHPLIHRSFPFLKSDQRLFNNWPRHLIRVSPKYNTSPYDLADRPTMS